jgi:triacylglycerol lipase
MLHRKVIGAGRELLAYARQASLLHRDLGRTRLPDLDPSDDLVVAVHGILATGGVMRPLRERLERHGIATAAMTYVPGPPIHTIAEGLAEWLDGIDARIHLVGHSLGGVVARYFAVTFGAGRVVQTISLASPFAGVKVGAFGGGIPLARDLDEQSDLLRGLRLDRSIPHLSVVSKDDHMIPAPLSHALPGGDVVVLDGTGHNALLYDARVLDHVARRVTAARPT